MATRLYAATRKGIFAFHRTNGAWKLAGHHFPGVCALIASHDPRSGAVYAALEDGYFGGKLHRSDDDGQTWTEVAMPNFPASDDDNAAAVRAVFALEPGGADQPERMWAGTIPAALFVSDDAGMSWRMLTSLNDQPEQAHWFGDGTGDPSVNSINVDPTDGNKVTVSISCGGVWHTADGGTSWALKTTGLWAAFVPPSEKEDGAIQDPHMTVQCKSAPNVFWMQHHNGIFKSEDGLESWVEFKDVAPSTFGFAVAVDPNDPDTAWFAPARSDEWRIPVDGKLVVTRTQDGGKSFEILSRGLPEVPSFDLVYRHAMVVDDAGQCLAMGSTTGGLWVSENRGDSWSEIPVRLPPVYGLRFV